MTNLEIIEELKFIAKIGGVLDDSSREALNMAIKALEQEPKTGHWIIDGHHRRCPKCDEYFCIKDAEGNEIPSSFCPNCGAKMESEDKE